MDCNFFGRTSMKRKWMDVSREEREPWPEEKPGKRRQIETGEKDAKSEKTDSCIEVSCFIIRSKSKENPLKRKRMDPPHVEPEPGSKEREKRRKVETEETDMKRKKRQKAAKVLSRYTLGKLLGQGSFGYVYAGVRKSDGKKVALKFIPKHKAFRYLTLPGDTERLPLEVALMELACKPPLCPYVIELLEWCKTTNNFILVLERPDPCLDLFQYSKEREVTEAVARTVMRQVVHAALHCRDQGVLHRDIKEENILVNPQTLDVKLIDFGCGDLHQDAPYTRFAGTQSFAPPEWIVDYEYKAEPATVWSLGILLYRLLCGAVPFSGDKEIVDGHLVFSDLSNDCCRLIWWCLERDPTKRPTLEQILGHDWFFNQAS